MMPKFLDSKSEEDFHLAMLELIVSIDDSHASFYTDLTNDFFGNYWIPARLKLIDSMALVTEFYNKAFAELDDLKIGDVITKVDGLDVQTIFQKKEMYINGSNLSRKKLMAYRSIFNGATSVVEIDYVRDGTTAKKTLKRYSLNDINYTWNGSTEKFKILDSNIGYVDMAQLKIKDVSKMMKSLQDTKAIIFDLRYGSDWTLHLISNYINSQEKDFLKQYILIKATPEN
jgi:C-terminal processing protease CtpA/Prc